MKKSLALRLASIPAFVMSTAGAAHAAVPADVTSAMADMKADALVVAGAFLVAVIAIAAFKMMRGAK